MQRVTIVRALAIVLAVAAGASSVALAQTAPAQQPSESAGKNGGWDVVIYPVLAYLPVAGIDVTLPESSPCTGCPPSVPSASGDSGLSGAWFASFRVEKSRLAIEGNVNYAGLTAERSTPLLNLDLSVISGFATVGVKIVEGLYAEAGARYYELDLTARILSFPEAVWKPNTFMPLVGATFRPQLAKRWRLYSHVDYTGFTGDASSVNGNARLEWRPIKFLALTAGYGFSTLRWDSEIAKKPINLKYTLHGPIIGIGVPF